MVVSSLVSTGHAQSPVLMPVEISAPITHVFVPVGFDDNDTVEIIIHGHFANTCFKAGTAFGIVDEQAKTVRIAAKALSYASAECLAMRIPFVQVVKLGQIPAGSYVVRVQGSADIQATLEVATATTERADDYLYAPVEDVLLEPVFEDLTSNRFRLTLSGVFPSSAAGCMVLQEVLLLPFEDVLIVLPKAKVIKEGPECLSAAPARKRRFSWSQEVDLEFKDDFLIHVRVLNGQSLNKVIQVTD